MNRRISFGHVAALSGGRRTDDDQRPRGVECGKRLLRRRLADGDIAWVAIDRAQRLVDGACGISPDEVVIAAEAFQPAMEPLRPIRIGVTVGNESAVLERYGIIHQCSPQGREELDNESKLSIGTTILTLELGGDDF